MDKPSPQAVLPGNQPNPFIPVDFGEGPKTATGATKHTGEPEYNEVVRPSTTDLSGVQAKRSIIRKRKI